MKAVLRRINLLLLMLAIVGTADAQYQKKDQVNLFGMNVIAGFNKSQVDGDFAKGFKKKGIYAGISGLIRFSYKSQIEIGFVYSEKGSTWGNEKNGFETRGAATLRMDAIEVPISFKYFPKGPGSSIYWEGGLAIAQVISKELDEVYPDPRSRNIFQELDTFYKKSELSLLTGLGVRLNVPISIGLRFTTGLTHILDKNLPPVVNSSDAREIGILRNYNFTLLAGYEF